MAHAAVAACLLAWLALVPFAQVWHLGFGAHAHRYCPRHERIEEVAPFRRPSESFRASAFRAPAVGARHIACSLLNWDMTHKRRALPRPDLSSMPEVLPVTVAVVPATLLHTSSVLILAAPKNSPPRDRA